MNIETICIAGGTGLVGNRMIERWSKDYKIHILSRSAQKNTENIKYFKWNVDKGEIDTEALKCDHLINLTGAGIADKRWSEERKELLISSRVNSNKTLLEGLEILGQKPKTISCASAIGYYGDRKDEVLTESTSAGEGFLSECSIKWEDSSALLEPYTDKFSIIRIGIVLSTKDGALPKMLMTKNFGTLSYFGNGEQYYSWIHLDDLVQIFESLIKNKFSGGIINAVAPEPLSNKAMMQEIAASLGGIPLVLPAPAFALKLVMGEMADVVLNSNRVIPKVLKESGFKWQYDQVGPAVRDLIDRDV